MEVLKQTNPNHFSAEEFFLSLSLLNMFVLHLLSSLLRITPRSECETAVQNSFAPPSLTACCKATMARSSHTDKPALARHLPSQEGPNRTMTGALSRVHFHTCLISVLRFVVVSFALSHLLGCGGTESYDDRGIIPRSLSYLFDQCVKVCCGVLCSFLLIRSAC